MSWWLPILTIPPLLVLQGFFSGAEMAMVSCNRVRLRQMADRGERTARWALWLLDRPERLFTVTLVGQNIANVTNTSLFAYFLLKQFGDSVDVEILPLITLWPLILVFSEIVPKAAFKHYADSLVSVVAPILYVINRLARPLLMVIGGYGHLLRKFALKEGSEDLLASAASREELKRIIQKTDSHADVNREESRMVARMLDFGAHKVEEALVPLIHVEGIECNTPIGEALERFSDVEHSRLPVFEERVDRMIGIIHSFDLLTPVDRMRPVREFMRDALFVPPNQGMGVLFENMRQEGHSMVIVVNEYGGAEGIVTIEDLVEFVVGEIDDEFDEDEPMITQLGRDSYLMVGRTTIEEFNETLPVPLPSGDYETVAGFLLEQFQRVPGKFEFLNFGGLQFTIVNATDRSIDRLHVRIVRKSLG